MEAIRVKDKEWQLAGVHYVRTEAMCNGFGVSLEMEFGEDKAGDEYILVLDGIHPVSTCRLHMRKLIIWYSTVWTGWRKDWQTEDICSVIRLRNPMSDYM